MNHIQRERIAADLKQEARRLGFDGVGISRAERLDEEARRLEEWLSKGRHATMSWMERNFEKRVDPRVLVPGARSVISVLYNYYQPTRHGDAPGTANISRYAWGDDYHEVFKDKLAELFLWMEKRIGPISGRVFVDSAPVMDKVWAARSGLGWIGKHSNLLNRHMGSFFFIGEIIVDAELPPDSPTPDYCGSCTRCIDACPTGAIYEPYTVDSNRCISYLTIEHRGAIDEELHQQMGDWIFGCDICQDVCPWNKFSKPTREERFMPRPGLPDTPSREWLELDLESFRERFRKNPVKRARFDGFKRNVRIAVANSQLGGSAGSPSSGDLDGDDADSGRNSGNRITSRMDG